MNSGAILLALLVAPYWQQANFIAELRQQNVYVYCEYDGPKQLSWVMSRQSFFVRPLQVQVLLQPDTDKSVKLLGKSVLLADVHEKLIELRESLRGRLGLDGFALVVGCQTFPDHVMSTIYRQQSRASAKSKADYFYVLTPCGITNFRYVRELSPEAFGDRPTAE